jgi:hypothetical protein
MNTGIPRSLASGGGGGGEEEEKQQKKKQQQQQQQQPSAIPLHKPQNSKHNISTGNSHNS